MKTLMIVAFVLSSFASGWNPVLTASLESVDPSTSAVPVMLVGETVSPPGNKIGYCKHCKRFPEATGGAPTIVFGDWSPSVPPGAPSETRSSLEATMGSAATRRWAVTVGRASGRAQ